MTSAATASFVPTALIGSRGRDVSRRGTTHVAARREPFRRAASRAVAVLAEAKAVAPPLTKKDLVDYLASGCKPKENWRCVADGRACVTHPMGRVLPNVSDGKVGAGFLEALILRIRRIPRALT